MLKGIQKITIFTLLLVLTISCSRKKNTFLNRNAHAVTAEFNTLYNGNIAFEKGKQELANSYKDNFWEILPVERIMLAEENLDIPSNQKDGSFNKAEEKAVKAIQKHAIYIDGKEYNPQIDEAYILLGKSRYFDRRFIPALDAFNFILDKYPTSNNINHAKVWKAKTNIRLHNEEVALENLSKMFEKDEMNDKDFADASAIMAQAFISLDSLKEAIPFIKQAAETEKNKEIKGRYIYIKGQLYNKLEQKDSANMAFDEVIALNRKSPRSYMINAYIEKAKNFDYDKEDQTAQLELLFDLEKNRENRPFLDKIYNQIGEYFKNNKSIDTAVFYYNKSIQNYKNDPILQSYNYQTLAEINFDAAAYKTAGAYYDSTLTNLAEKSRRWRQIKKKRENLDDVIKYEDIATRNDSILKIVAMSKAERLDFFTNYTSKLKQKAIADSIAKIKEEEKIANQEFYKKEVKNKQDNNSKGGPGGGAPSTFYFYNSSTVAFGKQEFKKVWGNRKLEDNWRISSKKSNLEGLDLEIAKETPISKNERYKPETYIARIPTEKKAIDSIAKDRNFAYYQLGLIYKEKFKEYQLAANRLETLLNNQPEERLILPAKYNLYKIYTQLENPSLASKYKKDIINNYADSRYAEILQHPESMLSSDKSSPEFKYKDLYKEFEASKYQQVIEQCDLYITQYNGNDIVPKFELLKATALGRQQGFKAYKKALNFVALTYPNSEEGKEAQNLYSNVLPKIDFTSFVYDEDSTNWKIVYRFDASNLVAAQEFQKKLNKAINSFKYTQMNTSLDYYNPTTYFVIIHGLNTRLGGRGFAEVLKEHKDYRITNPYFEISSPNYKIIQIHKNLDAYLKADLKGTNKTQTTVKEESENTNKSRYLKKQEDKKNKAKKTKSKTPFNNKKGK